MAEQDKPIEESEESTETQCDNQPKESLTDTSSNEKSISLDNSVGQQESGNEKKKTKFIDNLKKYKIPVIGVSVAVIVPIILVVLFTAKVICFHDWAPATCSTPKTCENCERTEGSVDPDKHSWLSATCTESKRCLWCSLTEGEPLGHTYGEWKTKVDYVDAENSKSRTCSVCDETEKEETKITSLVKKGKFVASPEDMTSRLNDAFDEIDGCYLATTTLIDDEKAMYGVLNSSTDKIAIVGYQYDSENLSASKSESENVADAMLIAIPDNYASTENLSYCLAACVLACDPSLSFESAKDVAIKAAEGKVSKNGIKYATTTLEGFHFIAATVS